MPLLTADRGFYSWPAWDTAQATGAALLWRAPTQLDLPVLGVLPDGTYLTALIKPSIRGQRRERLLAAATERARIARDLHDSAGHAISVIAVRAGAARCIADQKEKRRQIGQLASLRDSWTERAELARRMPKLRAVMEPAAGLWIAWPKRASKVPTDLTEDVVRELALANALVDNKVAGLDEKWSGLRLVIGLRDR